MATAFTFDQANVDSTYSVVDPTKKPGRGIITMHVRDIDTDKLATATGSALAVSDIIQMFNVPRGYTVINAGVGVYDAATAAATASIGMNAGTAWFMSALAMNDISMPASTAGSQKGSQHNDSAADTLDLLEAGGAQTLAGTKFIAWMLLLHTGERTRHVYPT